MRTDYMTLGATPAEENQFDEHEQSVPFTQQINRYKAMIEAKFPIPEGVQARIAIKRFPHDFGSYSEVCVAYDRDCEKSGMFAYHCENNIPLLWTDTDPVPFVYVPSEVE